MGRDSGEAPSVGWEGTPVGPFDQMVGGFVAPGGRALHQSLVGLVSWPSLKRPSTFLSGVSGSSSWPSLKRRGSSSSGSWCMPSAKSGSRSSSGVLGFCSWPSAKPSSGCSGRAGSDLLRSSLVMLRTYPPTGQLTLHESFFQRPLDRATEGLAHRRVRQTERTRGLRAVVVVAVEHRAHHLPAHRRRAVAHAEGALDERGGRRGDAGGQEAHAVAHAGHG